MILFKCVKRDDSIDILKGVSIIGVVLIHAFGLALSSKINFFIWNWMHFVVVGFVLSSGYVLNASRSFPDSFTQAVPWFRKRIIRLLFPYYIYLFIHIVLSAIFPTLFSGYGIKLNTSYILESFLLTGGIGLSWIPALFIEMMIVFPILYFLYKNKKGLFHVIFLCLFASSLLFVFVKFPDINYRIPMIFPWAFILSIGIVLYHTAEKIKKNVIIFSSIIFGVIFANLFLFFTISGQSIVLTHHKYPPDIVYLSYALSISLLVLYLARKYAKGGFVSQKLSYLGQHSYALFFTHYIFLDLFSSNFKGIPVFSNSLLQGVLALCLSVVVLETYKKIRGKKLITS